MVGNALIFLIQTLGDFFAGTLLLRFWLQCIRAPIRNPLSEFVQAVTNFVVLPARRFIPGLWGTDLSSFVLAWVTLIIEAWLVLSVKGYAIGSGGAVLGLIAMSGVLLLRLAIYLAIVMLVLLCLVSWINQQSWINPLLTTITRPILRPIRRVLPLIGNFDLSPLVALVVCQLLLMVPIVYLEKLAAQLLV